MEQINELGQSVTVVHWMMDTPNGMRVACMPNMVEFHATAYHPPVNRTDDVRASNCRACKKTAEFKSAVERLEAALRGPITRST